MNIPDFNQPPIAVARVWPQQLAGVQAGRQLTSEQQHEFAEMLFRTVLQNPPHSAPLFALANAPASLQASHPSSPARQRSANRAYSSERPAAGFLLQAEA
ncbi:hypothetical protein [Chromobacterium sphagni]|uniref:Uncharacterized protein n=1 Tax=Chromobacterium sphagni TaxID=1903179 RepID=A0A1S1X0P1_9NEIS|nr:hypothetical protein [Chromobacterium sphagni]OHX12960.1 hypothetical protein BI347_05120 [Chromobacterium sphagni]OHX18862.1 hypothetical protein BI344_19980 [Chromobacterium sphagni]